MKYKLGDVLCIKDKTSALWNGGGPIYVKERCDTPGNWVDDHSVDINWLREYPHCADAFDYFKKPQHRFSVGDKVIAIMDTPDVAEGWVGYVTKLSDSLLYPYEASHDQTLCGKVILFKEKELELLSGCIGTIQESNFIPTAKLVNSVSALDKQVSGSHYKNFKIQPAEYCHANNIPFLEGNVIKYTSRHRAKNGKKDLEKAIHCLELLIELEYKDKE